MCAADVVEAISLAQTEIYAWRWVAEQCAARVGVTMHNAEIAARAVLHLTHSGAPSRELSYERARVASRLFGEPLRRTRVAREPLHRVALP
jgi:hypothetical protein